MMNKLIIVPLGIVFLVAVAVACTDEKNPFNVKSEKFLEADNAAAMAFAPDGRLFYAEQFSGNIRVVSADGQLQTAPFAHIDVALYIEWGLTGLALDPDFADNHYLYAYYTEELREETITITPAPGDPNSPTPTALPTTVTAKIGRPVVIRYTDENSVGTDPEIIVGDLPETFVAHPGLNANGKIHFGPDGFLYISLGDYDIQAAEVNHPSQDLSTPIGKLLRVNKKDGKAPRDNPFVDEVDADPRIFAYGFREPFDFAFRPESDGIYGTDNTPVTCEELNIISAGKNYGWPNVGIFPFSDCGAGSEEESIHLFAKEGKQAGDFLSFVEVSGLAFAAASTYPTLGDSLLVCERSSALPPAPQLRRAVISGAGFNQVTADEMIIKGCQLAVTISPDGIIYYSDAKEIKRLIPQAPE